MEGMKHKKIYGYIRVSSLSQSHDIQKSTIIDYTEYRKFEIMRIFEDKASGANVDRPGFNELYKALEDNIQKVDAIAVTKLDRLGRNLRNMLEIVHWLNERGIGLIIIGSNVDTTTAEGRMFFNFLAVVAEYEREVILERTAAGRAAAKEAGVKFGCPRKNISVKDIKHRILNNVPISAIARQMKVSRATIYRRLDESEDVDDTIATLHEA